ncbi:MAG: hypothetical protein E7642_02590 [Ruminococcaceae bacterium]|nr:hypothetical protein [Oscillospiraceae bacterium]
MKKIFALVLCALMICSCFMLTACEEIEDAIKDMVEDEMKKPDETDENGDLKTLGGKTPEQLYADANTLLKNATNFTITAKQDIIMEYQGQKNEMKQTVLQKIDGDNSYYKISGVEGAESEGWYVDGVIYTTMGGVKAKATLSKKDYYEKFLGSSEEESKLFDIPESWFTDIVIKQDGEEYYMQFSVSGEEYSKLMQKAELDVTLAENVDYKVYFDKDGKILRMETDFDMEMEGVKASTHTESIFSEVGTTKGVTAPEDADTYQDVTEELNSMLG